MLERQPVLTLPKACFGLELRLDSANCQACHHLEDCRRIVGDRPLVPLSGVMLAYTPEALAEISLSAAEELRLLYEECYRLVFQEEFQPDYLLKHESAVPTIQQVCRETKCDPALLFLCSMHGHQAANPHTRFYSSMLLGQAAPNRLAKYRQAVQQEYGSFDVASLSLFAGRRYDQQLISRQLLLAEQQVGAWVVGYKLRKAGRPEAELYRQLELRLPEIWLATEPTYDVQVLRPWSTSRAASPATTKHRIRVGKAISWLKSHKPQSVATFQAREKATREAMPYVLSQYGLRPNDLAVTDEPVVSSIALWARIGLALQQLYCWQALRGDRQAWRRLGSALA